MTYDFDKGILGEILVSIFKEIHMLLLAAPTDELLNWSFF